MNSVIFVLVYRPCKPLALAFEAINEANLPVCYCFLRCLFVLPKKRVYRKKEIMRQGTRPYALKGLNCMMQVPGDQCLGGYTIL